MAQDHYLALIESAVIRFVDLDLDRDYTVRIKKVEKGKIIGVGGKSSGKGLIHFEGHERPMVAGRTVLEIIGGLYGKSTKAWIGKWIAIFADPTVKYGGQAIGGVRPRSFVPKDADCVLPKAGAVMAGAA